MHDATSLDYKRLKMFGRFTKAHISYYHLRVGANVRAIIYATRVFISSANDTQTLMLLLKYIF